MRARLPRELVIVPLSNGRLVSRRQADDTHPVATAGRVASLAAARRSPTHSSLMGGRRVFCLVLAPSVTINITFGVAVRVPSSCDGADPPSVRCVRPGVHGGIAGGGRSPWCVPVGQQFGAELIARPSTSAAAHDAAKGIDAASIMPSRAIARTETSIKNLA